MRLCNACNACNIFLALGATLAPFCANSTPALAGYYTELPLRVLDSGYAPRTLSFNTLPNVDVNGDGKEDLLLLGADFPMNGVTTYSAQPGRVFLGDGKGGFVPATEAQFPVSTLNTVNPRKVLVGDLNGDKRPDIFIANTGWDGPPFPGEQNRLYLAKSDGTWLDATASLPQLNDYSHTAAMGDLDGDGKVDIFVGNGYAGQNKIQPYTLMNQGSNQFVRSSANVPVGPNEGLNNVSNHLFPGATLADLDGDGLPELLITGEATSSFNMLRQTTIFWNHGGKFSDADTTLLPITTAFKATHIDMDVQAMDVNGDGLPDLVMTGTQGNPYYDGWFVQILINHGNRQFIDETSSRLAPSDAFGGKADVATGTTWAPWVQPMDFNGDGYIDFALQFNALLNTQQTPLVWLNDGTGKFSTLKVADFVAPGNEWVVGGGHFMRTDRGYSIITPQSYPGSGGLRLTGLMASQPYTTSTAAACAKALSASTLQASASAASESISVTTGAGCGWSASSGAPWISLLAGANSVGSSTLQLALAANPYTSARQGKLTVAGQAVAVSQDPIRAQRSTGANESITGAVGPVGAINTAIFSGQASHYRVTNLGAGALQVQDLIAGRDGTDSLSNIQRLQFSDQNIAFNLDASEGAGAVYRIYAAAFNRTPDLPGLGYWILQTDLGKSSLSIATDFTYSAEFQTLYGVTIADNYATGTNVSTLVIGFFQNVLHRTPDVAGLNFYVSQIQARAKTVGQVLAEIADSPENRTNVALAMQAGIAYRPFQP